ncbi:MAG TPA: TolC family protein [Steroidobacteraceae bacterium]|nr:TolC family protein [Steroidobacteraceae bacterium]
MSNASTSAQLKGVALAALAGLALAGSARADDAPEVARVTDGLVAEALLANLGLDQAEANVDQRLAILDQARAEYLPQIDLQLRYSEANGGRTIEIPALGLDFKFLREREQESFVRLSQPIYDARLGAQKRGAEDLYQASRHGLEAYELRLARDVRQAYYRWLAARESIAVLKSTEKLAAENERVNDSLFRNGKVTRDLRLRAEAEHLEITQQLLRARAAEDLGRRYLNLLCNAPLAREPEAVAVNATDLPRLALRMPTTRGEALESLAVGRRAELRELDSGIAAAGESERAARAAFKPQLAFAVDAGTQGAEWDYSVEDSYVLASFIVRFNLFNGGGDHAAIREAKAKSAELAAGRALAEQQIRIEVQAAITDLEVAEASLETASRRTEAAEAAYTIVAKKRDLGQVSQADYLDSQRALTQARLNENVTRFETLGALAQVEYAIGGTEP